MSATYSKMVKKRNVMEVLPTGLANLNLNYFRIKSSKMFSIKKYL